VDYNEETDNVESAERLNRLTNIGDSFLDEVHPIRNQVGADVVAMIGKIDDTGGIGWVLPTTAGNPTIAFNLNRVQQVAYGFTLIHEIGHNMGK
jgi:hypothetical protein